MEILDTQNRKSRRLPRVFSIEMLVAVFALLAAAVMIWAIIALPDKIFVIVLAGIVFTACVVVYGYMMMSPDNVRARQTDSMLMLSSRMVDLMAPEGMTFEAAQSICEMLLPNVRAIAVAITDTTTILGYAGYLEVQNPQGANIRTQATHDAIEDGRPRVLYSTENIGLPKLPNGKPNMIKAAIIVPLRVGRDIRGTLKFYFRYPRHITETQRSIALGFGELLATQLAATEMEEQRELATNMELKMLQNQINPHFLFNTINTIASLIRTDPDKARTLLRDFAVFYRSTLENSQEKIPLARELDQTQRYFSFEVARFGEDRLELTVDTVVHLDDPGDSDMAEMQVPPFLLQPLVENAVKHAMPAEGKLTVRIYPEIEGDDILMRVEDDGVGMSEEARNNIMHPTSQTGLGIAVKNVHDRMLGYYGPNAEMIVDSTLGEGTTVSLRFPNMVTILAEAAAQNGEEALEDSAQGVPEISNNASPEVIAAVAEISVPSAAADAQSTTELPALDDEEAILQIEDLKDALENEFEEDAFVDDDDDDWDDENWDDEDFVEESISIESKEA